MREQTIKVDTEKLIKARGEWRRPVDVARKLEHIGLTRQKLWNYEHGIHDVPESTLKALCDLYEVDISDISLQVDSVEAPTEAVA